MILTSQMCLPNSITSTQSKRGLATLSSFLLPGTGQLLMQSGKRGEIMLWIDGTFWSSWIILSWYQANRNQDALLIASRYAGAYIASKDARYYRALERYNSADDFNENVRREARELYPNDPDAQRRYYESRAYLGDFKWHWTSDSIRIFSFWKTRKSARNAGMAASFVASALILNRVISVLDCIFYFPENRASQKIEITPTPNFSGIQIRYRL